MDFTQTTNARIFFTVRRARGLVDAGAEPVFASSELKSTVSLPNSAHCTYMWSIHAAYMRTFRLHCMCIPFTCWPLQALAEARTLAEGRRVIGPCKCVRKLERLWGAGTLLEMTRGFSLPMPATAYACQKGSNVRGCVGPAEDTSLKNIFTFTFTFTFTITFTSAITFTSTITFTFTSSLYIYITYILHLQFMYIHIKLDI